MSVTQTMNARPKVRTILAQRLCSVLVGVPPRLVRRHMVLDQIVVIGLRPSLEQALQLRHRLSVLVMRLVRLLQRLLQQR
jgi:hypothetical protein